MSDPSTTPEAPTVQIGTVEATLVEPPALFTMTGYRRGPDGEIDPATVLAYGAAALRMCWPEKVTWPCKPRPREWYPGVDVIRYGGQVYDGLRRATRGKVSIYRLHEALQEAEAWAIRSGLTEAELEEARRFLAPGADSIETPSASAETTASPPPGGPA